MRKLNDQYLRKLYELISSSPFPHHMRMRLISVSRDQAKVELATEVCHLQPYGIVHGGVMATLIDTATFWAAFARLPEDAGLVNVDLKLNYLKPVKTGLLSAEGTCLRPGKTICYAEARVVDEQGDLVAHGTSTLMVIPGKGIELGIPKFLDS
ncbi:MAG: PaaI family thioesterase [Deltaproteobacteria bacterium]|nr:MAG: PaaI family thioesterase [Deltaproteobacteria bacterium]